MLFLEFIKDIFSTECFFRVHLRMYCPGCGGTRALVALLHGQIIQSIKYNPITLLFVVDVILTTGFNLIEKRNPECYTAEFRLRINQFLLIFILLFFLIRNILLYVFGIDMLGDFC